ncbi:hypothetical protein [Candidatus Mycoplasma haematohominis]|uniref:Uncharacterized protein n=1 Tax=Candidatus Mycoplasma haematohominis TaxID=1494318 RepID=A0A478FSF7_9MOLU|nr:hypothetical protein [Candidatus Mycoplasma haemohominis]GCE63399.1 hypothetical protein MHSWG343_03950 [Candidatus Mycoplasma haemohominis]
MSIFSTIVKTLTATGVLSGAAGVGSKIYLKNGHGFGTMDVVSEANESEGVISAENKSQDDSAAKKVDDTPEVEPYTFGSELKSKNYTLVDQNTSESIVLNILMERLDPTKSSLIYYDNQRFQGSPRVEFKTQTFNSQIGQKSYALTILQKPDQKYVEPWKQACIESLKKPYTDDSQGKKTNYNELARLREWCTVPTISQVLKRHKLTPLNTDVAQTIDDSKWKTVINGGWFKKDNDVKYWEKQSFIEGTDLTSIVGEDGISSEEQIDTNKINVFKKRCQDVLSQPFERTNFYLSKEFVDGITVEDKTKIDLFQEAALFCVEPFKATDYIVQSLQGEVSPKVVIEDTDYCYLSDIDKKDTWTTNNPLGGKSFWCAVKSLYMPKTPKKP